MAYGTRTIPAVDKIFGPSNAYVCEAMRQVFGTVGVGGLPGPSELMIIADGTARPDYAAADLLAQAEHGSGREKLYLVATAPRVLAAVDLRNQTQLQRLSPGRDCARVLDGGFLAIEVKTLEQDGRGGHYVARNTSNCSWPRARVSGWAKRSPPPAPL